MSLSLSRRIEAPAGRRAAGNNEQAQPVVKSYTFQKDGQTFSVMGYDTPEEELMLRLAWEFYINAADVGAGLLIRDLRHFEMFARFFVDDRKYGVRRKLPGLYDFLWESSHMRYDGIVQQFWPQGHPFYAKSKEDLRRCTFNMKLLAKNVRWYVDAETRFWNTLEFRIDESGADHAIALRVDYVNWLESHGLQHDREYIDLAADVFNRTAPASKHPFFDPAKKAGRLNPELWSNDTASSLAVVLANRSSQQKRGLDNETKSPNDMSIDPDEETASVLNQASPSKRPTIQELSIVSAPVNPNQPINAPVAESSMESASVSSESKAPLRIMPVPQYGFHQGHSPKLAYVYANRITLGDLDTDSETQTRTLNPPAGVSNTGDNIISIIYNKAQDGKTAKDFQVMLAMIKVDAGIPTLLVRDYRFKDNQASVKDDKTQMVSARPSDCCVSWDGRRIAITDKLEDGSYWVHTIDLTPDEKTPTMLKLKKAAASIGEPVLACTSSVLATSRELRAGDIAAPMRTPLKVPQEPSMKLVSVSTNAWMQRHQQIPELEEACKHTVFVHLYERKDGTYLAIATPLSEDGTQINPNNTFTQVELKLPVNSPTRSPDDTTKPRVLWYPVPFYAAGIPDAVNQYNVNTDQALVLWCIHKGYTALTVAPKLGQNPDDYVAPQMLAATYTPTPILNDLLLRVFNPDFTPLSILDFQPLTELLQQQEEEST